MSTSTPEQLQKVAEWLGVTWTATRILSFTRDKQFALFRDGAAVSDADLFCAIDDKCVAEGRRPTLETVRENVRFYRLWGPVQVGAHGDDRLSAAIAAVLKMLEAPHER